MFNKCQRTVSKVVAELYSSSQHNMLMRSTRNGEDVTQHTNLSSCISTPEIKAMYNTIIKTEEMFEDYEPVPVLHVTASHNTPSTLLTDVPNVDTPSNVPTNVPNVVTTNLNRYLEVYIRSLCLQSDPMQNIILHMISVLSSVLLKMVI